MDQLSVLTDRISAHLDALGQAEQAVDWATASYQGNPSESRTSGRDSCILKGSIAKQRSALNALQTDIEKTPPRDRYQRSSRWWCGLTTMSRECKLLFAECLAYAIGPLTRGLGWQGGRLDGGLCPIADAMLEELAIPADKLWSRRTVLAGGEFMAEPAQIIRLRFPVAAIWDLPVAAHEFGHLVGLRDWQDFRLLTQERRERPWLHEHCADMFATYTLGPAFACTCLLTRFDPTSDPDDGWDTHPSAAARAHVILRTLDKMAVPDQTFPEMAQITKLLSETWLACLEVAAPRRGQMRQTTTDRLDRWIAPLYTKLEDTCLGARYDRWSRAEELAPKLRSGSAARDPATTAGMDIRDVINAAWHARISIKNDVYGVGRVSQAALQCCQRLLAT